MLIPYHAIFQLCSSFERVYANDEGIFTMRINDPLEPPRLVRTHNEGDLTI